MALGEPRLDRFEFVVVARVRSEFGDDAAQPPLRFPRQAQLAAAVVGGAPRFVQFLVQFVY